VLLNVLLAAVVISGCTGRGGSGAATSSPTSAGVAPSSPSTIGQPPLGKLSKLTRDRLAPDSARVDLVVPSFSHPTRVTNPLFPISTLNAVIVEEVGGEPLKIETTLLPETKTVEWNGRRVEAVQSQFCAYLKGRITEVAVDLYAQADDGSVWYLGEDVVDDWAAASATVDGMTKAWNAIRAGGVPPRLGARISQALEGLAAAVGARNNPKAPQAALDVADASLDLQLRYRPVVAINLARLDLWAGRLLVDATARTGGPRARLQLGLARPALRTARRIPRMAAEAVSAARATLVTSTTGLTVTPFGPMAMIATGRPRDPPPPPKPLPPIDCLPAGRGASGGGDCFASGVGVGPLAVPTPKPPPEVTSDAVMSV
jgi:hypothetical protein